MLSRAFRRLNWQSLQEFATKEADSAAFRTARALNVEVSSTTSAAKSADMANPKIDWSKYQSEIRHQELVNMIKAYHDEQVKSLDALLGEDQMAESKKTHLASWDVVYGEMLHGAEKAVEQSEEIIANGAKALYISANNPSVGEVSTSEWIDTDQYWSSFVEKHQYYHNHLDSTTEDPESKEYETKLKTELMKNLRLMDDVHPRKAFLYQKPSYEYYNFYKAVLVEHMTYYLVKVGGDARTFPELPPHSWMNEIYEAKFQFLNILQRRRRIFQEETLARELDCEFMPHDLVHGEGYYAKMIARENQVVEQCVGRLMASYSFLSDAIPVQTSGALYSVIEEGAAGKWYSLGDDVNAVFFQPAAGADTSAVEPTEAWASYSDHLALTGTKLHPVMNQMGEVFSGLVSARKQALNGSWFNCPGESSADAFLRRLKSDDPCYPVYEEYVAELKAKWEAATEISEADAISKISDIEAQYYKDLQVYEKSVLYSGENPETKAAQDKLSKAAEAGELLGMLESGSLMAFSAEGKPLSADEVKAAL